MSYLDSDVDYHDWLNGTRLPANAVCSECGAEFWKGRDDDGSLCDRCCSTRDALKEWDARHERNRSC